MSRTPIYLLVSLAVACGGTSPLLPQPTHEDLGRACDWCENDIGTDLATVPPGTADLAQPEGDQPDLAGAVVALDAPTFAPPTGTYSGAQVVEISSTTPDALIYYTTDGSTPTSNSIPYTAPVTVARGQTLQAIAVRGVTRLFVQPSVVGASGGLITPAATPHVQPSNGVFQMINWQTNPNTATGNLVPNALAVSAKTGFVPLNAAMAQLGYANAANVSTGQMEGNTVGAYLSSADRPGAGLDTPDSQNKMMMTPEYRWDFATAPTPLSSPDKTVSYSFGLRVPTASGKDCYVTLDSLWQNANGTQVSYGVKLFSNGDTSAVTGYGFDIPTSNYMANAPLGFDSTLVTAATNSAVWSGKTWSTLEHFQFAIGHDQFVNALQGVKNAFPAANPDLDPSKWKLVSVHLNAEFHWNVGGSTNSADLGWSMQGLAVSQKAHETDSAVGAATYVID